MFDKILKVFSAIIEFSNLHTIEAAYHLHRLGELKGGSDHQDKNWAKFEGKSGVYCIFDSEGEKLKYIGMSQSDTGSRLFQWLFPKTEIELHEVQQAVKDDENTLILSIALPSHDYMAPALESFLIEKLKPELNKKA